MTKFYRTRKELNALASTPVNNNKHLFVAILDGEVGSEPFYFKNEEVKKIVTDYLRSDEVCQYDGAMCNVSLGSYEDRNEDGSYKINKLCFCAVGAIGESVGLHPIILTGSAYYLLSKEKREEVEKMRDDYFTKLNTNDVHVDHPYLVWERETYGFVAVTGPESFTKAIHDKTGLTHKNLRQIITYNDASRIGFNLLADLLDKYGVIEDKPYSEGEEESDDEIPF